MAIFVSGVETVNQNYRIIHVFSDPCCGMFFVFVRNGKWKKWRFHGEVFHFPVRSTGK